MEISDSTGVVYLNIVIVERDCKSSLDYNLLMTQAFHEHLVQFMIIVLVIVLIVLVIVIVLVYVAIKHHISQACAQNV